MPEAPTEPQPPQPPRPRWRPNRPPAQRSPDQRTPDQRTPDRRTPESERQPEPAESAVLLARAEQRLAQERQVMQARLDRERDLRRIQVAMGWLIVVMLPSVALVCVAVMINYDRVPRTVLNSAAGAFFVDIVGLVVAGWRTLLIRNLPDEPLVPVTEAPELHHTIDVDAAEVRVKDDSQ